ncbi:indole-3-glycerol phosphate synthase TrpC [Candidatus Zinderia endosymbiont of Aphrophora alni]|uniref:indole-3-glycerol phosphate synthase TrpC n=1 Tax=Candidatus Zinderia endosymbiont of Aphrophora alni TaxID=3077951 RepID=UPI0030CE9D33
MQNILKKIIKTKKREISFSKKTNNFFKIRNLAEKKFKNFKKKRGFEKFLIEKTSSGISAIIAEIKKASPIKGLIKKKFNPNKLAINYYNYGATCLSVLTDKNFFYGSYNDLLEVKKSCKLPILCKDFVIDLYQIYEMYLYGADAILLISSLLNSEQMFEFEICANNLGMDVLVEVHNYKDIEKSYNLKTSLIGINNRNLNTFKISIKNTNNLLKHIPKNKLIITESGIYTKNNIKYIKKLKVNIFLIGEVFMKSLNPGLKLFNMFYKK